MSGLTGPEKDKWAEWLLQRRFGGDDPERRRTFMEPLVLVRDRVLENTSLAKDDTLLDVGAGDGLIAFGALDLIGGEGRVIFSDVSRDLLDRGRELAEEAGVAERCSFLRASADDLSALGDESVDVVTTRSVLIYVEDKRRAFEEFYRVLKSGGRLSIFEPINRFEKPEPPGMFFGYDAAPVADLAAKVRAVYERIQPLDSDPMLDFDERDLLDLAESAGFGEVHLNYEAKIVLGDAYYGVTSWDTFLHSAGNPRIPTLGEAINEALTPEEAKSFTAHLRPLVENAQKKGTSAVAYLWAIKRQEGDTV